MPNLINAKFLYWPIFGLFNQFVTKIEHVCRTDPSGDDSLVNSRCIDNKDIPLNIASNKLRHFLALLIFLAMKPFLECSKHFDFFA